MARSHLGSVPEVLLTVAEKTLDSQPVFLGLSGPQLSRLAREVYVQLKNNGKQALAEQARVLTDPAAIAKALQQLQRPQQQQPYEEHKGGPSLATSCPCCTHPNACWSSHATAPQPQIVPIVLQQQPQLWPLQQQLQQQQAFQTPQPCLATAPQHQHFQPYPPQQRPQQQYVEAPPQPVPFQTQRQASDGRKASPSVLQLPDRCSEQTEQPQEIQVPSTQPQLSRKACVARLLFALVAAKVARDILSNYNNDTNKKKTAAKAAEDPSGLGGVSVESLAEPLAPRLGLFAGLHKDLLLSLQQVVAAAIDGANAAAAAVGFGPVKENSQGESKELPPLYLSPAEQGQAELTEHEKHAAEIIQRLLNMKRGENRESLRLEPAQKVQSTQQQQQQQLPPGQQLTNDTKPDTTTSLKLPNAHSIGADVNGEPALDAAFQDFVRRDAEYKGPNPLSIEQQLRFYGLYKRATAGRCTEPQPSKLSIKKYKKWEAWKACDALTATEAKKEYVDRAKQLDELRSRL